MPSASTGSPKVVVINETLRRRFFPGEDPVGKRINLNLGEPVWTQIVGVVGDVKYNGLADDVQPAILGHLHGAESDQERARGLRMKGIVGALSH